MCVRRYRWIFGTTRQFFMWDGVAHTFSDNQSNGITNDQFTNDQSDQFANGIPNDFSDNQSNGLANDQFANDQSDIVANGIPDDQFTDSITDHVISNISYRGPRIAGPHRSRTSFSSRFSHDNRSAVDQVQQHQVGY